MYAFEIKSSHWPELSHNLHVPKYFLNNFHDLDSSPNMTVADQLAHTHFPTIFFGAPGSGSPLHSDGVPSLHCASKMQRHTAHASAGNHIAH